MAGIHEDPELSEFFDQIVRLAAAHLRPDDFLRELDVATKRFEALESSRKEESLRGAIERFAKHRLRLVDVAREYAEAGNELLVLSMALNRAPQMAAAALKIGIDGLSHDLHAPGAAPLFAKLLRRLKAVARESGDAEMLAWLRAVVSTLPDE